MVGVGREWMRRFNREGLELMGRGGLVSIWGWDNKNRFSG